MSNKLIEKLSLLTLEKKHLKIVLDTKYYDRKKRQQTFEKIKEIDKEIEYVKFKLEMERKIKNANNNSN